QRMEARRRILGEMAEEERALLQKREVQTATSARRTTWIIVLGSLAALGLVVTASLRLQRELAGRMQAEEALRQANDVLDQRVQERTAAFASVNETLQTEITERVQAEAALRDSEARKGAIVESAIDGIITIDQEGKIIEFNPAAERLLGHPRTAAVGQLMADLIIPPSLRERHHRGLAHYLATGEGPVLGKRLEMIALHADGTEFPIELGITRVGAEEPALFTGFLRDITERRQAEAARQHYTDRLELLHKIDQALIAEEAPEAIAGAVIQALRELLGVPRVIVNIFDLAAHTVEWLAAAG